MFPEYNESTTACFFSFFHIENSAGLLKCNGIEHLVKKKKATTLYSILVCG
jgi:hypothetical protein